MEKNLLEYKDKRIKELENRTRKMSKLIGYLTGNMNSVAGFLQDEVLKKSLETALEKEHILWKQVMDESVKPEDMAF
jgi:hypothetical protein